MQVKYCVECIWSAKYGTDWELRCTNPLVNCKDYYALSSGTIHGSSTSSERCLSWYHFPVCGLSGKQWTPK